MFVNLKNLMRNRNEARKREYAAAKNLQMVRNDKEASRREKYASMQRLHESQELANSFNKEKNKRSTKKEKLKTVVVGLSCAAVITGIAYGIDQYNKKKRRQPIVNSDYSNVSRDDDDEKYQEPVEETIEEVEEQTEVEASNTNTGKSTVVRGYSPQENKMQTTYKEIQGSPEGDFQDEMTGTSSDKIHVKGVDQTERNGNITFETDKITPKEEKEDSGDKSDTIMDTDNAEKVISEEDKDKKQQQPEIPDDSNTTNITNTTKKPEEASDKDLDDWLR